MFRRIVAVTLLGLLMLTAACTNKKVQNPLANLGSKQPDKVLFDRAMDAMKHNRFDVARMTLQTLINTYPDSEYLARAKLAVGDSWYAEGGTAALAQAEVEYKDFITFFPNMSEAVEAQLKIANIHYQQMEKPDRDFTHGVRAEEEYRQLILQFPDSKLVPQAKQRLMEVQEVLAEREFRIGRFYYLRQSWAAAIARLRSLVDRYPLYSRADETLFMLGNAYEAEIAGARASKLNETAKGKLIKEFSNQAAEAYSRILTRYPAMARTADAKKRLEALHRPVPAASPEAVAQNKAEEASRRETGTFGRILNNFSRHPDVAQASKVGDPTLADPQPVSATQVVQETNRALLGGLAPASDSHSVAVETVGTGQPAPNQPVPRSDAPPPTAPAENNAAPPADIPAAPEAGSSGSTPAADQPQQTGIEELAPPPQQKVPPATAGGQPAEAGAAPLPPPAQVNDIQNAAQDQAGSNAPAADPSNQSPSQSSSSKKKKKHKVFPF